MKQTEKRVKVIMQMLDEFEHEQLVEHGTFALSRSQKKEIAERVVAISEREKE